MRKKREREKDGERKTVKKGRQKEEATERELER
jgi:hypothetical protein